MNGRIIVLGGGVIGLSCAWECRRRGLDVLVLERGRCGGQASGAAAGLLAPFTENPDGADDMFLLCLESLRRYPDWLPLIEEAAGLRVGYAPTGSLQLARHEADLLAMEARRRWQNEYGAAARIVTGAELRELEPELAGGAVAALHQPLESHLFAPDYVRALEAACRRAGVRIADGLGPVGWRSVSPLVLATADGSRYEGDAAIVCTGAWAQELERVLALRIPVYPIRGQICAYELPQAQSVGRIVFDSQGYAVHKPDGTLVCGASEDVAGFDTSVTDEGIARLVRWSGRLLPALAGVKPTRVWAGLRPATQDGRPLIGPAPGAPHVVVAAGHYRNGVLLSPATAAAAADLLASPGGGTGVRAWSAAAFAPERFTPPVFAAAGRRPGDGP